MKCQVCKAALYEGELASLCRDCEEVCKRIHAIHRGEDSNQRRKATRVGATGIVFQAQSLMSHDHPGHEDRMRAHEARVAADLAESELQTIIKRRKKRARHSVCETDRQALRGAAAQDERLLREIG
jgi:hypothetical protein